MRRQVQAAGERIVQATHIGVLTHERPDGDALGSLLAFSLAMEQLGKRATPVLIEGMPGRFRFLPGSKKVVKTPPAAADLLVILDCSDPERTGFAPTSLPRPIEINIDHHPTNTHFAAVNLVREEAAATTELLCEVLPLWGVELEPPIATNLLTGLITDTIGFRTHNVRPETLETAADLMRLGAPLAQLYERSLHRRSFVSARYWGMGLSRLARQDGIVWTSLTLDDRRAVGYPGSDDADLINILSTIEEARVAIIFVEQPGAKVKVSWRSEPGLNVARLASCFGGGGHEQAAGATLEGSLEEVTARVLAATAAEITPLKETP